MRKKWKCLLIEGKEFNVSKKEWMKKKKKEKEKETTEIKKDRVRKII